MNTNTKLLVVTGPSVPGKRPRTGAGTTKQKSGELGQPVLEQVGAINHATARPEGHRVATFSRIGATKENATPIVMLVVPSGRHLQFPLSPEGVVARVSS